MMVGFTERMTVRNPINFNILHLSHLRMLCFTFISIFTRQKNKFIIITVNRVRVNFRKTRIHRCPLKKIFFFFQPYSQFTNFYNLLSIYYDYLAIQVGFYTKIQFFSTTAHLQVGQSTKIDWYKRGFIFGNILLLIIVHTFFNIHFYIRHLSYLLCSQEL